MSSRKRDPNEFVEKFGAVKRRITALASEAYAKAEVGSLQAKLLRHIGRHARISQADLARATESDPTLTGRALQTLIERGLVRREHDDDDGRKYVLELGAAGRRMHGRIDELRGELVAQIGEVLDDRDLEDFDRIAKKLLAAFEVPARDVVA
jgi:DNA-binding MarR family transcriptional regulator